MNIITRLLKRVNGEHDGDDLRYGKAVMFCAQVVEGKVCAEDVVALVGKLRIPMCRRCKLEYEAALMKGEM